VPIRKQKLGAPSEGTRRKARTLARSLGRAVEGELKGWTLDWVDSVQVKWFAWASEYPRTSIAGKR
jgi:hypothetical protein